MVIKAAIADTCSIINLSTINNVGLVSGLKYTLGITIYVDIEIKSVKCRTFLRKLEQFNLIKRIELTIEDLVEMSKIPLSKRVSNGELSCYIKANEMGVFALSDDKRAIKYMSKYINVEFIKGILDFIEEAFLCGLINEFDVENYIQLLNNNQFRVHCDYYKYLLARRFGGI